MLQNVAKLMNISRTHILFDHEVFKTELFLKYRETMSTLCSTSVNPVFQSLKAVLTELSSQLTNLQYDVNGHQKTSMCFCVLTFVKSMIMLLL